MFCFILFTDIIKVQNCISNLKVIISSVLKTQEIIINDTDQSTMP